MTEYVYGLSKSGLSVIKLLTLQKKSFHCWDDNKSIRYSLKKKFSKLKFTQINNINLKKYNNIYLTPGLSISDRKVSKVSKSRIKRDLNLYYQNLKNETVVAITGTNGKSTTTKLIGDIIKRKYKNTFVGGNIGDSLCNSILNKSRFSYHVIELSSFQLETIKKFEPKISILLNLSKDHLDRYKNFKEYINAKKNILNSKNKNINLISIDDKYSKKIFNNKKIKNKISFSLNNNTADIYYSNGFIVDKYFYKYKSFKLINISSDLSNTYNIQNILATYIVCKYLNIPVKYFTESVKKFRGLPYRSSIIFNSKSKIVINNSKATNVSSSLLTLDNKKNIFLILGGIAKKEDEFHNFNKYKDDIIKIYIYGKSRYLIKRQIGLNKISKVVTSLDDVVKNLRIDLSTFDCKATIIFAPACASFDQFDNFEKRGNYFNKLIKNKIKK
ncbi:MAG: UDP-N-acetylmuramoyl-L-alanine--D-glutamate ligase [Alphaproteobacteria bacterium]